MFAVSLKLTSSNLKRNLYPRLTSLLPSETAVGLWLVACCLEDISMNRYQEPCPEL